jgi:hypothetical protein
MNYSSDVCEVNIYLSALTTHFIMPITQPISMKFGIG